MTFATGAVLSASTSASSISLIQSFPLEGSESLVAAVTTENVLSILSRTKGKQRSLIVFHRVNDVVSIERSSLSLLTSSWIFGRSEYIASRLDSSAAISINFPTHSDLDRACRYPPYDSDKVKFPLAKFASGLHF